MTVTETPLVATYLVEGPAKELTVGKLSAMGEKIAIGQTIGTAQAADMPFLEPYKAWVVSATLLETPGTAPNLAQGLIRVAYPLATVAADLGTLLAVTFGKLSMAGKVRLVDLSVPPLLAQRFEGPRYGMAGIRRLVGVPEGPMLMSIFKPCLGLPPSTLGEMFFQQALGGVNLVKDDEILSDPDIESARHRLAACLAAAERARQETGRTVLYAINLTGPADTLLDRARTLAGDGATAFLFNYLCYGLPMFNALRQAVDVPFMAHPALAGAFYGSPAHGIDPAVLFGQLPRLAGADLVLFPSPYGSVALPHADALAVKEALLTPQPHLLLSVPVPSAGIQVAMVPQLVADFGPDFVVNAGTGIHDFPGGSREGAHAFAEAIAQARAAAVSPGRP